eukprot:m.246444 g.246444  ORF g.246444 m.246444 type:complete len:137 (-) comp33847_c2_seq22:675-1085(-)
MLTLFFFIIGETFVAFDGSTTRHSTETKESLRFYSAHGGKSFISPLLHMNPQNGGYVPTLTMSPDATYDLCNWCYRSFPSLNCCETCHKIGVNIHYCDTECQKNAWKIHKVSETHMRAQSTQSTQNTHSTHSSTVV